MVSTLIISFIWAYIYFKVVNKDELTTSFDAYLKLISLIMFGNNFSALFFPKDITIGFHVVNMIGALSYIYLYCLRISYLKINSK